MKQLSLIALCVFALVGCTVKDTKQEHAFIKPIPSNINLSAIKDATIPAVFSISDFNWSEKSLSMTIYSIDLYDSTEISKLQLGDTILFRNDKIIVDKIENGKYLTINGGIEYGGVELAAYEGGTYRVQLMDDHPQYTKEGKVQLPLSDSFTIIDCGDNPEDPYDTIRTNHRQRLENMKEYKHDFIELNTRVKIENGKITNITRNWIP